LIDSSSSKDEENFYSDVTDIIVQELLNEPRRGGSIIGHETVDRERLSWNNLLYRDYFSENPIFDSEYFRRRLVCSLKYVGIMFCPWVMVSINNIICLHRFRMRRHVFVRIMNAVEEHDDYFVQKKNASDTLGLSCLKKGGGGISDDS
jgi:hypothetical protein